MADKKLTVEEILMKGIELYTRKKVTEDNKEVVELACIIHSNPRMLRAMIQLIIFLNAGMPQLCQIIQEGSTEVMLEGIKRMLGLDKDE